MCPVLNLEFNRKLQLKHYLGFNKVIMVQRRLVTELIQKGFDMHAQGVIINSSCLYKKISTFPLIV